MGPESIHDQEKKLVFSTTEALSAEFELLSQGKYGHGVERALAEKVLQEVRGDFSKITHEMVRTTLEAFKKFKSNVDSAS